jgi:peptidoglycan-associated lipoprotein
MSIRQKPTNSGGAVDMKRKTSLVMVALALVMASVFLMTSCAKKQVKVSEGVQPTAEQPTAQQPVGEKQPAVGEAKKVETGVTPEYQKAEAERQARLRELARQQKLLDEIREFENQKIYFDFDKSELKPEARAVLRKKADWLLKHPEYSVRIEGHCDERGTNEYNLALGQRRADSAKKFLVALGVDESRISTISYGEERPADPRHNEEAWAKNRRDEFKLIK